MTTIPATAAALGAAIKACMLKAAACAIALAPGSYPGFALEGLAARAPVSIQAAGVTLTGRLDVLHSSNLRFSGLTFAGPAAGLLAEDDTNFEADDTVTSGGASVCISLYGGNDGVIIKGGSCTGSIGDCIDVAGSNNVVIEDTECLDPQSTGAIHPDAVQGWAIAASPTAAARPLTNIEIRDNVLYAPPGAYGSQGFDVWNHGDPALVSNVRIDGNIAISGPQNCLALLGVTNGEASGNTCVTEAGPPGKSTWTTAPYPILGPGSAITGTVLIDTR